jgi:hypothetical protein
VLRHVDARVCPLPLHYLASNFPHARLLISAATPTIRMAFPSRLAALPKLRSDPGCRSNPIAHRVRRKRQRLPPSLPIENASDRDSAPSLQSAPRRFRSRLATIRPESGARVPPSFMVGGSGARTFGCWTKGLQCRSKTGSQMLAFEASDLRGFLFRFIEVPFLSARHNDLFVVAAIRPTTVRLAPSRGRSSGDQTQPQRWSNRAGRS